MTTQEESTDSTEKPIDSNSDEIWTSIGSSTEKTEQDSDSKMLLLAFNILKRLKIEKTAAETKLEELLLDYGLNISDVLGIERNEEIDFLADHRLFPIISPTECLPLLEIILADKLENVSDSSDDMMNRVKRVRNCLKGLEATERAQKLGKLALYVAKYNQIIRSNSPRKSLSTNTELLGMRIGWIKESISNVLKNKKLNKVQNLNNTLVFLLKQYKKILSEGELSIKEMMNVSESIVYAFDNIMENYIKDFKILRKLLIENCEKILKKDELSEEEAINVLEVMRNAFYPIEKIDGRDSDNFDKEKSSLLGTYYFLEEKFGEKMLTRERLPVKEIMNIYKVIKNARDKIKEKKYHTTKGFFTCTIFAIFNSKLNYILHGGYPLQTAIDTLEVMEEVIDNRTEIILESAVLFNLATEILKVRRNALAKEGKLFGKDFKKLQRGINITIRQIDGAFLQGSEKEKIEQELTALKKRSALEFIKTPWRKIRTYISSRFSSNESMSVGQSSRLTQEVANRMSNNPQRVIRTRRLINLVATAKQRVFPRHR